MDDLLKEFEDLMDNDECNDCIWILLVVMMMFGMNNKQEPHISIYLGSDE